MSTVSVLAGACVLLALSSTAARAQAPSAGQLRVVSRPLAGAVANRPQVGHPAVARPSLVGPARLGVSPPPPAKAIVTRDALNAAQPAALRHRGPGVALMIVGAAGIITGLLIDEDIITVAGAGAGLVGLYLYLR